MAAESVKIAFPEGFQEKVDAIVGKGSHMLWQPTEDSKGFMTDGKYFIHNAAGVTVAFFKLVGLPGCCGVCVSCGAGVYEPLKKGLGTLLNEMRIVMAKKGGFGVLLCTDRELNTPQRKILAKNGWKDVFQFKNPRSQNVVNISVKDLTRKEPA